MPYQVHSFLVCDRLSRKLEESFVDRGPCAAKVRVGRVAQGQHRETQVAEVRLLVVKPFVKLA